MVKLEELRNEYEQIVKQAAAASATFHHFRTHGMGKIPLEKDNTFHDHQSVFFDDALYDGLYVSINPVGKIVESRENVKQLSCDLHIHSRKKTDENHHRDEAFFSIPFKVNSITQAPGENYKGAFLFTLPGCETVKITATLSSMPTGWKKEREIELFLSFNKNQAIEQGLFPYSPQRIRQGLDSFTDYLARQPTERQPATLEGIKNQAVGNLVIW